MSTMGSSVSRESSAAPVPAITSPVATTGYPIDDLSGRTDAPGQDKKRKADDASAEEDALPSASSSSRAAKRARVEVEAEHAGGVTTPAVPESIFGGPRQVGPPRATSSPSSSSKSGDEVVFVSSRKRARVPDSSDDVVVIVRTQLAEARMASSSPAAVEAPIDHARGQKRGAEDGDDCVEVGAHAVKRLRANDTTYFVEAADEEVARADLPHSAADVVRAADSNDMTNSGPVVAVADPAPRAKTGFFDLPLEIREMIYHEVLVAKKAIMPRVPQRNQAYRIGLPIGKLSNFLLAVAPIDRTRKVIKGEIMPFLFRHNEFKLTLKHHKSWLNSIPRKHAACIRRMVIECNGKNKHAAANLLAFQNTIRKRLGADQVRELTYQFLWSMNSQTAVRHFDAPESRHAWKKFKRLEKITVDTSVRRGATPDERFAFEEQQRVLSRLVLDSGVPVHGRALRPWRRDKLSLPWGSLSLKDDWKAHVIKNKKGGKWDPKTRESWENIINVKLRPSAAPTEAAP